MKKYLTIVVMLSLIFTLIGCDLETSQEPLTPEQLQTQDLKATQSDFITNQPTPKLSWSLERENINKRTELWNDPNKISYIYLISDNGVIMAFFPIKGKVTGLNSYATPNQQIVEDPFVQYSSNGAGQVVDAPDELGTYGENNEGIFFFLTDGTYVEWNGMYLLVDQPIKLTQQPVMIYEQK